MNYAVLNAEKRTDTGKGVARKLRAAGNLPAIFYSAKSEPVPLILNLYDLDKVLRKGGHDFIKLTIKDNDQSIEKMTLIKEIQRDILKRTPIHLDFWEIDMDQDVEMELPLKLIGEPAGVEDGGVLEQLRREIMIAGHPRDLVEVIEVDVSHLRIGDVLHVFDIDLGDKMRVVSDNNYTLATVAAPTVGEAEGAREAAEGEEEAEEEAE